MLLLSLLLGAIAFIVFAIVRLKLHPFLALLLAAIGFGLLAGQSGDAVMASISQGFGNTLGAVGPLIVIGVMIGALLDASGGAQALAARVLRWIGEKRVPWGMALMGFITSIPVFGDSTFIILQSLNRALTRRAGLSLAVTATALSVGLMASHCLVPPTPGPIAAAELVGADLGLVIGWGVPIGLIAVVPAVLWAQWMGGRIWIDPAAALVAGAAGHGTPPGRTEAANPPDAAHQDVSQAHPSDTTGSANVPAGTPTALKAALPIFVPLALIMTRSLNNYLGWVSDGPVHAVISFLGTPLVALLVGLGFAVRLPGKNGLAMLAIDGPAGKAIRTAAVIIVITGAGGAFGMVLRNAGMAEVLGQLLGGATLGLWLPFIISAAIRAAQGSATVAIVTTAALVTPLLGDLGLGTDLGRALVVLAIGAGAAGFSHANDSGFWVITQLSDMTVAQGLKLHSVGTSVLGISAAVLVNLVWWIWG